LTLMKHVTDYKEQGSHQALKAAIH
jgi:hypothetical protein